MYGLEHLAVLRAESIISKTKKKWKCTQKSEESTKGKWRDSKNIICNKKSKVAANQTPCSFENTTFNILLFTLFLIFFGLLFSNSFFPGFTFFRQVVAPFGEVVVDSAFVFAENAVFFV